MWSTRHHRLSGGAYLQRCFLFIGLAVFLSGCTGIKNMTAGLRGDDTVQQSYTAQMKAAAFADVLEGSYTAADTLAADLRTRLKTTGATLLAASFVDINDLEESSPLGRIISEQISSRMAQNGFRMREMKLRQHSIYIKEGDGEFMLSREIREISASHDSDLVIVGTYAVAEKSIYISARIVDAASSTIITGYDYQLKRNYQTDSLLGDSIG